MLIVVGKSIREEQLYQPLPVSNKQYKITVTFLTGYNGIVNVKKTKKQILFRKISD